MERSILDPAFDNPFQFLAPDERDYLDSWYEEGRKELTLEVLHLCISLVLPASSDWQIPNHTDLDRDETLRDWFAFCKAGHSNGGQRYKTAMDNNVATAIELHNRREKLGNDPELCKIADHFLRAAREEYSRFVESGVPDRMRFWRKLLQDTPPRL